MKAKFDLKRLADGVAKAGLMDKRFGDMSLDDVTTLVDAVLGAMLEYRMPRFDDRGDLVIPFDTHPDMEPHRFGDMAREKLREVLTMLGAGQDTMRRYLGDACESDLAVSRATGGRMWAQAGGGRQCVNV